MGLGGWVVHTMVMKEFEGRSTQHVRTNEDSDDLHLDD